MTCFEENYPRGTMQPIEVLAQENDWLRAALAQSELPCAYCQAPAADWSRCPRGFPGCARADDALLVELGIKRGDIVDKNTGYPFPGEVLAVFLTKSHQVRVVVESTTLPGLLHIFNKEQLYHVNEEQSNVE